MAKIKLKNIDKVAKALNRSLRIELNKLFKDKELRLSVGRIIEADIKKNFDAGVAARATVKIRQYLEQYNQTDSSYKRNKIKALFTGQLLNDLATNVKGFPTQSTFEVAHSNKSHKGYKTRSGNSKPIKFGKLSEILINKMQIDYFVLSKKAQKQIADLIIQKFSELIKELNR